MLAPKKVQEQYTSTRTTSKLATHGLLGEDNRSDRSGGTAKPNAVAQQKAAAARKEQDKKEKDKKKEKEDRKQREKEEKVAKAKAKKAQQQKSVDPESADSSSTAHSSVTSSTKVEGKQRRHSAYQVRQVIVSHTQFDEPRPAYDPPASPATSTTVSIATTSTASGSLKKHASFESSLGSTDGSVSTVRADLEPLEHVPGYSDDTLVDRDGMDADADEEQRVAVTRTPHAEAFAALDPNVIEYVRSKGVRGIGDGHNIHWSKRWLPGFGRPTKSITNTPAFPIGPSNAVIESTYSPPWMTIAGRSAQESNERLIQNLNDSFKDVGLVHSKPSKPTKKKKKSTLDLFGEVPEDALYMLLPLWAAETDEQSAASSRIPLQDIPVDKRLYLLVYYDAFDDSAAQDKPQAATKKKTKSRISPPSTLEPMDPKTIILTEFKVSARVVGYAELRGCGVRLPSTGLSVTGPAKEAMQFMPPTPSPDQHRSDFSIISHCHGRERGVVFEPSGLDKLGLCFPPPPSEGPTTTETEPADLDIEVHLTPIGRAAVEMVWLGCLAMTSFGAI